MKFIATLAVAVAAVNAVALPEAAPAAEVCFAPGAPCDVAKRAAEAFASAIAEEEAEQLTARDAEAMPFCRDLGGPCHQAKRNAEALALALAGSQDDGFLHELSLERRFSPADLERRQKTSCLKPGQACHKAKREPEAETEAEALERRQKTSCLKPGQACHKAKRMALDARSSCNIAGAPCHMTKRAAEAVIEVIEVRDAEEAAEFERRQTTSCPKPGQACHKKRETEAEALERRQRTSCLKPGQACHKARSEMDIVEQVARSILEE